MPFILVSPKNISSIDLPLHIRQTRVKTVGQDNVALGFEGIHVIHHLIANELAAILQCGFVDDDVHSVGFQVLNNVLDGRSAEVVAVALHRKAIDSNGLRLAFQDGVGNELLAHCIALYHGFNHSLRDILVVRKKLLSVFREAVAAVAEGRVVVVAADARVHAYALNDLLRIQTFDLSICIELVEIAHADGEVGVGEKFDGLGLGRVGNQGLHIFVLGTLGEQVGEHLSFLLLVIVGAHDDAAGVQVVVEGLALAEELRGEDDVVDAVLRTDAVGVAHGDGALDDHQDFGIHF